MNTGLTHSIVGSLAIDPSVPARVYAGTSGGGVFDYEAALETGRLPVLPPPDREGRPRIVDPRP